MVWKPKVDPSPFVTKTATEVFRSVGDALACFQRKGYIQEYQLRFDNVRPARERGRQG